MALSDKTLVCVECGSEFIFTAGEQEFFQARGFGNEPKRCRSCRAVRRTEQRGGGGGMYQDGPREMYPIVCAECGNDAMVPSARAETAQSIAATVSAGCAPSLPPASSAPAASQPRPNRLLLG